MFLPRYKHAIGNAPVRFPTATSQGSGRENSLHFSQDVLSVSSSKQTTEHFSCHNTPQNSRCSNASQHTPRPTRWSLMILPSDDVVTAKLAPSSESLKPPLLRSKSSSDLNQPRMNPRQSDSSAVRGHSSFNKTAPGARIPDGNSLMRNSTPKADEMTECLPPSSSTLRPSSWLWTATDQDLQSSLPPSKYGSISSNSIRVTSHDDPYGYRAMAGPALLPIFHEQLANKSTDRQLKPLSPFKSRVWLLLGTLLALSMVSYVLISELY